MIRNKGTTTSFTKEKTKILNNFQRFRVNMMITKTKTLNNNRTKK